MAVATPDLSGVNWANVGKLMGKPAAPKPVVPKPPMPTQPSPTEFAQWHQGESNARMAYNQQLANQNFNKSQAQLNYNQGLAQQQFQNHMSRQQFDDPYVGRGLMHSGIRSTGLTNMYTQQAQGLAGLENAYTGAVGSANLAITNAGLTQATALNNYRALADARRTELASQIKGIN